MPSIRPEISIGNLLSMAVSCVAILSVIATLCIYGTTMRLDIDQNKREIGDIKATLDQQKGINSTALQFQTEVRVDLKYMREALDRIDNQTSRGK